MDTNGQSADSESTLNGGSETTNTRSLRPAAALAIAGVALFGAGVIAFSHDAPPLKIPNGAALQETQAGQNIVRLDEEANDFTFEYSSDFGPTNNLNGNLNFTNANGQQCSVRVRVIEGNAPNIHIAFHDLSLSDPADLLSPDLCS